MGRNYFDEDFIDPNNREIQNEFAEEFNKGRDPKVLIDLAKHGSNYSLYQVTRFLQYGKAVVSQSKKKKPEEIASEVDFINKLQEKITPIFMKKWLEKCSDRRIIFDYIKLLEFNDKHKKLVNETISSIHSIGYIKHFIENVDFADQAFIETKIKNGSDYCLKYEYGLHFPKSRKTMIAAMKAQADRQKQHEGIIKYYADELKKMKNAPTTEVAKMF